MKLGRSLFLWSGFNVKMISDMLSIPKRYFALKKDSKKLLSQYTQEDEFFPVINYYPCWTDKEDQTGTSHGAYFWQDLLCAQCIL